MPHILAGAQTASETPDYLADARRVGLSDAERKSIVDFIAANPDAGDPMQGTGGARKVRFAGRGNGKSGGYRIVPITEEMKSPCS